MKEGKALTMLGMQGQDLGFASQVILCCQDLGFAYRSAIVLMPCSFIASGSLLLYGACSTQHWPWTLDNREL